MPNFAGLYVGSDFVDLVCLSSVKGAPQIAASARRFLYEENTPPDKRDKNTALPIAIKKVVEALKASAGGLNFGLSQDEVMIRRFRMPYLAESERANAVKFEAQKYLPFKVDDTVSDFYITDEAKQLKTLEVLFAAASKHVIQKYVALFEDIKAVKLNAIDTTSLALTRILSYCKKIGGAQAQLVVYLERDVRVILAIVKNKDAYLAREINFSTSKAVFFENVLNNIRLSIDYYKRETKEVFIDEMLICGEGDLLELEIYLKDNVEGIVIQTFNLTNEIYGLNDLSRKQMIAIGIALASFEKPRPRINLLAKEAKAINLKDIKEYKPVIIEGAILFTLLVLLHIAGSMEVGFTKRKIAELKSQKMAVGIKEIFSDSSQEELLSAEGKAKLEIEFLKNLVGHDRFSLTKKLNKLGGLLPEGAWIESLSFTDEIGGARTLDISGMVYSEEGSEVDIVNKILADMKSAKDFTLGFTDIKLNSLEKADAYGKKLFTFSIKCSGQPLKSP